MQIQVLCNGGEKKKSIFAPQKDYIKEISQLLVHTLEEMRSKERVVEREWTKERVE